MCWTDRTGRLLRAAALLAAAAGLAACAPAGERKLVPLHGEALYTSMAVQVDRAGTGAGSGGRLGRAFAADVEPTVTFAFDEASLDARAQAVLDAQAEWLRAHPGVPMTIVGHADLVGPERYNYGLGLRRAESARSYLVARGIPAELLVAIESRGERDPLVPTTDPERLNRRAVTVVGRPGGAGNSTGPGLDGTYAARIYNAYQAGRVGATEAEPVAVN